MNFQDASKGHQEKDDLQQLLFTIIIILNELAIIIKAAHDRIRLWFAIPRLQITTVIHFSTPVNRLIPLLQVC